MTAIFCILTNSNAALSEPETYRPSIRIGDSSIRLNRVVVRHALSEVDASKRFADWLLKAKWSAIDTLRDMQADPYDVHVAATFLASSLRDRSRPFDLVQRVQDLYISEFDISFNPYAPAQFRFLDERNSGEVIASLNTPVRMRDKSGDVGTTPFFSLATALVKTDVSIFVKSGDDVGTWGDYKPPMIEWFIDNAADKGMRVFENPGTVSFTYANGDRVVVDLPEGDSIIGIDVEDMLQGIEVMYMSDWEWSKAILEHSMMYVPRREKPAIALYDDIVDWFHRCIKFRGEEFDESLEALRKALIDILGSDIASDLECDEVISGAERFSDVLNSLMRDGFDVFSVLRKAERGVLIRSSASNLKNSCRRTHFVMER